MGGGFLYFGILLFFFLFAAGIITLLISIFYIGEWMEKKPKKNASAPSNASTIPRPLNECGHSSHPLNPMVKTLAALWLKTPFQKG